MFNLAKKKDGPFLSYMSWKFSLRSIAHWLTPFGSLGWRENADVTIATFIFHLCLIGLPILALGHVVLLDRYHGLDYWSLPEGAADVMALAVMACCLYFFYRRHRGLPVFVGSEFLCAGIRDSAIARNDFFHQPTHRFNTQRQRRYIQQQPIVRAAIPRQHVCLN